MTPPDLDQAVALLEFGSIAAGIEAGDAMIKRAPLDVIRAGTIHPGKYVVLVGGQVADVEEALDAARRLVGAHFVDEMFLPDPHPDLVSALKGARLPGAGEALGVIETSSIAAVIRSADVGLKGARVVIREIFLGDDLGGKGYLLFSGPLVEVEAAVELATERAASELVAARVIAQLHTEMDDNLVGDGRFTSRLRGT
ncbi:MAG: BMC domain-containing protein [Acidimicrobiia bacterium]|nr:BMC domain-containing protein [Acidimicrobiia bacterium]